MGSAAPGRMPTALSTSAEKPIAYFLPAQIHLEPLWQDEVCFPVPRYSGHLSLSTHLTWCPGSRRHGHHSHRQEPEQRAGPTGHLPESMIQEFWSEAGCESSSFAPFLLPNFCSPLTLKESNYRNEITRQANLTPDLCFPE